MTPRPVLMPECHTASNVRYFKRFLVKIVPHLDGILVPSQAVKQDLVQNTPVSEHQIAVVPHGVDDDFFEATPAAIEIARHTYDLPPNYILTVGSLEPRKNLITLIKAFHKLPENLRHQYPLVITGASGWKNKDLRTLAAALALRAFDRLRPAAPVAGRLSRGVAIRFPFALRRLWTAAARSDGGPPAGGRLQPLGDSRSRRRRRTARRPARRRKDGSAIERMLSHPDEAAALGEAAHRQARQYSWQITAAATKAFFETIYGEAGS